MRVTRPGGLLCMTCVCDGYAATHIGTGDSCIADTKDASATIKNL